MIESEQCQPKLFWANCRNNLEGTPLNKGEVFVPNLQTDFSETPNLVKKRGLTARISGKSLLGTGIWIFIRINNIFGE